ncbi:hypothetical protein L7F22_068988 [Adiantum nelumboides]|nr:hypothetical protein [Adiantum nelumboides]
MHCYFLRRRGRIRRRAPEKKQQPEKWGEVTAAAAAVGTATKAVALTARTTIIAPAIMAPLLPIQTPTTTPTATAPTATRTPMAPPTTTAALATLPTSPPPPTSDPSPRRFLNIWIRYSCSSREVCFFGQLLSVVVFNVVDSYHCIGFCCVCDFGWS